jgi:flagella basal body P-ring formation protein FlgA
MHFGAVLGAFLLPTLAVGADAPWMIHGGSSTQVRAAVLNGLRERLATSGWQLVGDEARMLTSHPLPSTVERWHVQPRNVTFKGRPVLPFALDLNGVDGASGGAVALTVWLTGRLHREVLVMRHAARRGDPLGCDDTVVKLRDVDTPPSGALAGPCNLGADVVARRPLSAGDVLRASDVGLAPTVATGTDVRLRVSIGHVTLEKTGKALGDAEIGDHVLVRPTGSAHAVRGVVAGRSLVELGEQR